MGGLRDEVRGRSKAEAHQKYVAFVEGFGDTFPDRNPDPNYKKFCREQMVQDPESGEWVLHFHLHT